MNATMIKQVSYVDINTQLIEYAQQFFGKMLSTKDIKSLTSLSTTDKKWLLEQYKEEISGIKEPDLSNLY